MIYFVRHGATDWNEHVNEKGEKDPKCQGMADIPLNQNGINQAKKLAETLKNVKFDRVICSPMTRTRQTCEIIYNGNVEVEYDSRLVERDFGEFEGFTKSQFNFKEFCNAKSTKTYIKAESVNDIKRRVFEFLDDIKSDATNKTILIVSHGGVACFFNWYYNGAPESGDLLEFKVPNAEPILFKPKTLDNKATNYQIIK